MVIADSSHLRELAAAEGRVAAGRVVHRPDALLLASARKATQRPEFFVQSVNSMSFIARMHSCSRRQVESSNESAIKSEGTCGCTPARAGNKNHNRSAMASSFSCSRVAAAGLWEAAGSRIADGKQTQSAPLNPRVSKFISMIPR